MKTFHDFSQLRSFTSFRIFKSIGILFVSILLAGMSMSFRPAESAWAECPTALFTAVNNPAVQRTPVQFINQSTGATTYYWEFGDGGTSSAMNPVHIYAQPGTYTVRLTVTGNGCTESFIGTEDIIAN